MNDLVSASDVERIEATPSLVGLITSAEIDQQIATAHKFPRSLRQFRADVLDMVTLTEEVAAECIYALPRDGKVIEGPSARFAEIVVSCWGNSRAGARVVDDQGEFVTAQAVFHDLQKNVAIAYEVKRRIVDKNGRRFKLDMIGVTSNAACSIALRNAILRGVPKAFWTEMYDAARRTARGDVKTLANRRAEAFKAFQGYGVSEAQVCARLGVPGKEDIGLDELVVLRGILSAIREGEVTPESAFSSQVEGAMPDDEVARHVEAIRTAPGTAERTAAFQRAAADALRMKDRSAQEAFRKAFGAANEAASQAKQGAGE